VATIQPISTTRVTDAMTRRRLTAQIQGDQVDLFRLQNQLSTGLRLFLPSDDAAAAQRAIALQRTLERKTQSVTNLQGAQAALATTETALSGVNQSLNALKSEALSVVDSLATPEQREAVINSIDGLLLELTRVGNANFATNSLLGGAERSTDAYGAGSGYVEFLGDESTVQTFVDIGQLFDQGVSGNEVLGGLSEAVRGSADLNVQLTTSTTLDRLRGGRGVEASGSIQLTFVPTAPGDPTTSSVIDLSQAKSIGDVARLIESGAPAGSEVVVSIDGGALRVDTPGGGITINEVGNGDTAEQLGLLSPGVASPSVLGQDLDPTIDLTTRLDDLAGAKTRGRIVSPGADNDLVLTAGANGAALNGLEVYYQDGATAGAETAVYTPGAPPTLTVTVADGVSTATQVAAAITAEGTFAAEVDYRDQSSFLNRGTGAVDAGPTTDLAVNFAGGVDGGIDLASGLLVTNGAETYTIDTSAVETVEGLLGLLNEPEYGLLATVNETRDGFDIRTRRSGADFAIAENGGTTAADLGVRSYHTGSRLADFNRGTGVVQQFDDPDETRRQNTLEITVTEDGVTTTYDIDPVGLNSVQDLIDRITANTGGAIATTLATQGNGLVLTVTDPDSPPAAASGSFTLGADTLTIDALTPGREGNYPFTVEVVDSGGTGPLLTTVSGNSIVVDLQGVPATTDTIAAGIQGQLAGFAVTSSGTDTVSAAVGPIAAPTSGGAPQSDLAAPAIGQFTLAGDTIRLTATINGTQGNLPLSVQVVDGGGTGPLLTTFDPDTNVITVDLQGVDTTTDAIASSIEGAVPGYTVTSNGASAVAALDVPGLPGGGVFDATTTGGQAVDSITISGNVAERLGFLAVGEDTATSTDGTLASTDRNPYEVQSVFTTLVRMREALVAGDEVALGETITRLDEDVDRVSFGRAEIGVRLRNLEAVATRLGDEEVTLREALSNELDADLAEVISDYTAKQSALQASLQTAGTLLNLSILDFI